MQYRNFGNTDLKVSEVGFGAWAIGGPAQVGGMAIGWGNADDATSVKALHKALDVGINFYDTADFYGLGHSEELIGKTFGNRADVVVATKVGQRQGENDTIEIDYSTGHVRRACEASLRRLKRDAIDLYQLHTAKVAHLQNGELIGLMEQLQQEGKIRYWGISLNTFAPEPEAEYMLEKQAGQGFQVALNVINQRITSYLPYMKQGGFGVIARMPLQFGLLARKFTPKTQFDESDHRSFRLTPEFIAAADKMLTPFWQMAEQHGTQYAALALGFALSFDEVSTIIPGIRTPEQAVQNASGLPRLAPQDKEFLQDLYQHELHALMKMMPA